MKRFIYVGIGLFLVLSGIGEIQIVQVRAQGLNKDFGVRVWSDNNLWDDNARLAAGRLQLRGSSNEESAFYKGEFAGKKKVFGVNAYSMELYATGGKVSGLMVALVNKADLYAHMSPGIPLGRMPSASRQKLESVFKKEIEKDHRAIRTKLLKRLGRPIQKGKDEVWNWLSHQIVLRRTKEALVLSVKKGNYSPTESKKSSIYQSEYRNKSAPGGKRSSVEKRKNGDVVLTGIPPVNQGARNYCVPCTWEKCLRYYGLNLDVYELVEQGGTQVTGTIMNRFSNKVGMKLRPHGFKVKKVRGKPYEIDSIRSYIDKGYPIIWGMDAQHLRQWVERTQRRRNGKLPSWSENRFSPGNPAYHALLIIGYNTRSKEIALSDSTDLGSGHKEIWITIEDAKRASVRAMAMETVLPPKSRSYRGNTKKKLVL